jgi:hypothetical protein
MNNLQEIKDRLGWHWVKTPGQDIPFLIQEMMNICDVFMNIEKDIHELSIIVEKWDEKIKNGEIK